MVVIVLFATPESGHRQVPRVWILVLGYITAPPKPWASSDRFCPMSPAGYVFGNCSFVTGVGKCHHALAAGLTLIKLPRPFPEHSFSYLKWQLQHLCESFGAGTQSQHIPGKLTPGMLHGAKYCWPPVHPRADPSSLWRVYGFKIIYWFLIVKWNIHEYSIWILQVKTVLHSESQDPPWRWPSKPLTGFHKHVCRLWKKQFCGFFTCVWYKWYHDIWMGLQPGRVIPTWQYMSEIFILLIVHCISSGGQAVVYLALPLLTGMKVVPVLSVS